MKTIRKVQPRAHLTPLVVNAERWHAIDATATAFQGELAPVLRPLGEDERRHLLHVKTANAAFCADYVTLLNARPGLVPEMLRPADTLRDWATSQSLCERLAMVRLIAQQLEDTIAGLQADCYAAALGAYRMLVTGGMPAGEDPAFDPLRTHVAQRLERRRRTVAAKRALRAAELELANAMEDAPAAGAESVVPPSGKDTANVVAIPPRSATAPAAIAA